MNSVPKRVLPVPAAPCTRIVLPPGIPPSRISSRPLIPVRIAPPSLITSSALPFSSQMQTAPPAPFFFGGLSQVPDQQQSFLAFPRHLHQFFQCALLGVFRTGSRKSI